MKCNWVDRRQANHLKHIKKNEITVGGKVFNYLACGKPVLSSRMIALENLPGDDLLYYDNENDFIEMVHKFLSQKHDEDGYVKITMDFDWRTIAYMYEETLKKDA